VWTQCTMDSSGSW